ncbi:major facilitator transporter [Caballeronia calidae]|uniref:Major facilitator transporter n=2 Tax=Caballeronia calidae TaxID=1777139 RepID=A0A158CLR9_9BURK|nr:major facilitator transporter [Caballeronia calidae]
MAMAESSGVRRLLVDRIGPVTAISLAQLFGTSLWFSANGAAAGITRAWHASATDIGWLTSAVQAGFILGTLTMSLSGVADRFRASSIFVWSAILGAVFNAMFALLATGVLSGAMCRFLVGVCLAGIYPMGMKLIVNWAPEKTGTALAQLVAMLTLGSGLPHALKVVGADWPWQAIIVASSALALLASVLIAILGDGSRMANARRRAAGSAAASSPGILDALKRPDFRCAALGYFGHMWELYAFWTLVPLYIARSSLAQGVHAGGVSGLSFFVFAAGAVGCLAGGMLSRRIGSAAVAAGALAISGTCCVLFALLWRDASVPLLLVLMLVWGATVVADSPQFSALSAKACPPELVGSALAIQNSIGFAITVVSISAATALFEKIGLDSSWLLVIGPIAGLLGFAPVLRRRASGQASSS